MFYTNHITSRVAKTLNHIYFLYYRNNTELHGTVFYGLINPRNNKQIHSFADLLPIINQSEGGVENAKIGKFNESDLSR